VPGDITLETIKTTRDSWIAEFTRDHHDGTGDEFATYAFAPETGVALKEYVYPRDLGLACTDGIEFTFVMANVGGKSLKLLKLAPAPRANLD
jgi:hypothetical protein